VNYICGMTADFRSDTFTQPTSAMLQAMMQAKTGDDVFGEDPTINELESMVAAMFGMEAAIFCPSGTMTNQVAIKCHTQPGDEVICDELSHIYQYEGGGVAFNSGCSLKLLPGDQGRITAEQVAASIHNRNDPHRPYSKLVSLENTANRGGGSCYSFNEILRIKEVCIQNELLLHLDGARLFNALVAKNETPEQYGKVFDSISICLSKGLGAPAGSVLIGTKTMVAKARRVRKVLGGGMRQAGYIAAAGIYALKHHIPRLQEDHTHAQVLADALAKKDFCTGVMPVQTNIVIAGIGGRYTSAALAQELKKHDIKCIAISDTQVRMVTHLDITSEMIGYTIDILNRL
jgi:threonine aldolase